VRLDAIDDDDRIGFGGVLVHVHGRAVGQMTDDFGVHARFDRHTGESLGDAVALEHLFLPLGGGRAVAAHRRKYEGFRARGLQLADCRAGDLRDVGDAAAAAADRDALSGLDATAHFGAFELSADGSIDIGQADGLEFLPHVCHSRERHIQSAGDVDFDLLLDHLAALDPRECKSI
jgi:hypothetical protein